MATGNWFYSGKGIKGDIQKTSGTGAAGTYDVYTIFYTDGSASQYSIYNGKDGASLPPDLSAYSTKAQADLLYKPIGWTPDLSAYITKLQSDGYYLGINAQASDSAKLGGHLPSYFQIALGYTPLNSSLKGAVNGLAELGADGFVLNTQLPAYVDKIINVSTYSSLPATGVTAAIYITDDTNVTYRWSGSSYVEISSSLALGETNATAYRGDRGAIAYSHSQLTSGNPHNVTKANVGLANVPNLSFSGSNTGDQDLSGLVPKTYTVNGHALSGNVAVTQADLGLVIGTNVLAYRTFGSAANNNTSDFAPSSNVSFPGFGVTHILAAYGDHLHTGIYEVPLTFSTGLTRTGNTVTNNITQYTDALARLAQTNSSIVTALGYTPLSNATSFRTVNSVSVVGSGDISINPFPGFGTGDGAAWGYSAHPTTISGYGITDAILNQNSSAQSANMWISGSGKFGSVEAGSSYGFSTAFGSNMTMPIWSLGSYPNYGIGYNQSDANGDDIRFYFGDKASPKFKFHTSGDATFLGNINSKEVKRAWGGVYGTNTAPVYDKTISNYFDGGTSACVSFGNSGYDSYATSMKFTINNLSINSPLDALILKYNGATFASSVTASSFTGSGANITSLPINLTTTGTSGAATYTQATNTLNVPNYASGSGGSGSTYTPTITNISGATGIAPLFGYYTTVGGITTLTFCLTMTVSSGSGIIQISLPTTATTNNFTCVANSGYLTTSANYSNNSSTTLNIGVGIGASTSYKWNITVIYK
jgi:hypothetical protein